jgi:hypothetical protein
LPVISPWNECWCIYGGFCSSCNGNRHKKLNSSIVISTEWLHPYIILPYHCVLEITCCDSVVNFVLGVSDKEGICK